MSFFLLLAVPISFINSYLPDCDDPPRPSRGKNCSCATSQLLSWSTHSQHPRPHGSWRCLRRVGVGCEAQQADPVACLADRRGLGTTAVAFYHVWKPKSRLQFRSRMLIENGAPFPVGGRPENDDRKFSRKKTPVSGPQD